MGLKLHEDWGSTPAAIDNCLTVAEQYDIPVLLYCFYYCYFVPFTHILEEIQYTTRA